MAKVFRPFLRRFRIVFRPSGVNIRALKPDTFSTEYLPLLESVCFVIMKIIFVFYKIDDRKRS